jgi:hypothetical protein
MLRADAWVKAMTESTGRARALVCPCVATMPVMASLGDMGVYWPGQCRALLGQRLVPACSGGEGQPPGHAEVSQGREKGRVGMDEVMVIGMGLA